MKTNQETSESKIKNDQELKILLARLKEKTGIEFSIKKQNPSGEEETLNQIRTLLSVQNTPADRETLLRHLLAGDSDPSYLLNGLKKLHISEKEDHFVFLIEIRQDTDISIETILKNLFLASGTSSVVRMDRSRFALVTGSGRETEENLHETAQVIYETLTAEAMLNVSVSYAVLPRKITCVSDSFREAALALKIGDIFYAQNHIFSYDRLGIAGLIYELPEPVCRNYLKEVFGKNEPKEMDEETSHIVSAFFDNGLNIAETSRQLYMHRNTLVYRLEKISRSTGLDIRKFDDAVTWKIAVMIHTYLKYKSGTSSIAQ